MGSKSERRAALGQVTAYHEACVTGLVDHVAADIDRYRAGDVTASDVDAAIHQYQRAARELW